MITVFLILDSKGLRLDISFNIMTQQDKVKIKFVFFLKVASTNNRMDVEGFCILK